MPLTAMLTVPAKNIRAMDGIQQQNAPALSPELWAKVFAHMHTQPEHFEVWDEVAELFLKGSQREMHQLS